MSRTFSNIDAPLALKSSHDDNTGVLQVMDGFLMGAVGRKIEVAYPTATTETYTFKEGSTTFFTLTITYTDATKANISSAERTA